MNSSAYLLYEQYEMQLYEVMGETIKKMLQSVNPIAEGCYLTIFEFEKIAIEYY